MAEARLLAELTASLETHARAATFACGGSGSFQAPGTRVADQEHVDAVSKASDVHLATVDDVQVRFGQSGEGITVVFNHNGTSPKLLEQLIQACQPASFGRGGETILDEAYRKAGKLDRSKFATSFCPYEAGIVDVVSQLLVPQYAHDKHSHSLKAELYKLNVYSAPNGKFKAHVDTPRSKDQIGSLVVSLPSAHQGGQLTVRNAGFTDQSVVFDWSTINDTQPAEIKWAAFYSDCEHEVHEVTSGHGVPLTYNLFLTQGNGHLGDKSPVLDSTQLPLYKRLQDALDNSGFLHRGKNDIQVFFPAESPFNIVPGRVLAVYLTHCYAHTSKHVNFLPDSLKGADMSLWNTAKALGLKCQAVPVMTTDYSYYHDDPTYLVGNSFRAFNEGSTGGYEAPDDKLTWLNESASRKTSPKDKLAEKPKKTKETFKEVQIAEMSYGNEPSIDIRYSRAAMLIRVPPFEHRNSGKPLPKSIFEGIKSDGRYDDDYGCDDDESDDDGWEGEYASDEYMDEEQNEGESEEEDEDPLVDLI